ncbi:MAG: hypothetical protein EA401_11280, partial [Planctomycetota bacterium]
GPRSKLQIDQMKFTSSAWTDGLAMGLLVGSAVKVEANWIDLLSWIAMTVTERIMQCYDRIQVQACQRCPQGGLRFSS